MSSRLGYGRLGYIRLGSADEGLYGHSFSAKAVLFWHRSGSFSVDARFDYGLKADSVILGPKTSSFHLDAYTCVEVSGSLTFDACFSEPNARASQVVAEVVVSPTSANARASQLVAEAIVSPTSANARASQLVAEAIVSPTSARARASQVIIEVIFPSGMWSFTVGSDILASLESSFTLDASISPKHFSSDAAIAGAHVGYLALSAVFRTNETGSFSVDAEKLLAFRLRAVVKHPGMYVEWPAYAALRKHFTSAFSVDAWTTGGWPMRASFLRHDMLGSSHADAIFRIRRTGSLSANSVIAGRIFVRAALEKTQSSTFSVDAIVAPRRWAASADILRHVSGSFAASSLRGIQPKGYITANAFLNAGSAFSLYSVLGRTGLSSFSLDARIEQIVVRAITLRTMYADNNPYTFEHDNILIVTGQTETVIPGCVIPRLLSGVSVKPTEVRLSWHLWLSQSKNDLWRSNPLQLCIRLRKGFYYNDPDPRKSIWWPHGELAAYVLPVYETGNWVDGHREEVFGSFVDESPGSLGYLMDGREMSDTYFLTVQEVQGSPNTEIWSNAREFAAEPQALRMDALVDGWLGIHVSQRAVEAIVKVISPVARVSQRATEVAVVRTGVVAFTSQHAVEALIGSPTTPPTVRISQSSVEVLVPTYRHRFQAFAIRFERFNGFLTAAAVRFKTFSRTFSVSAVIAPRHTESDAVKGIVILDEPTDHVGSFHGLPYLYKGIISFTFWPGSDYSIAWHGGYVGVSGGRAYITDAAGRMLLWQDFTPTFGWWHVRFSVDAGYGARVYLKVWQDEEPYWTAEAYGPDAPPVASVSGTSAGSLRDLSILTIVSPWRFEKVFAVDAVLGTSGSFTVGGSIKGTQNGTAFSLESDIKGTRNGTSVLAAVVAPVYPTFSVDSFIQWYIPGTGNVKWRFWCDARIERGFYISASIRPRFSLDAVVSTDVVRPSFDVKSWVYRPVGGDTPGSFTWDSVYIKAATKTFTLKAWFEGLPPPEPYEFYISAYVSTGRKFGLDARIAIVTHPTGTFVVASETSDTYRTRVFEADAIFHMQGWWHLWCDAVLKAMDPDPTIFGSGEFGADAFFGGGGSFSAGAILYVPITFTADAWTKSTLLGEIRFAFLTIPMNIKANAVIYGPVVHPLWMSALLVPYNGYSFSAKAIMERGFLVRGTVKAAVVASFTVGAYILPHPVRWFGEPTPGPNPGDPPVPPVLQGNFSQDAYTRTVSITGVNMNDVVWAETSFTMNAKSGNGNFHLVIRGDVGMEAGTVVALDVDGLRQFGGIALRVSHERFQPDVDKGDEVKTIIEGPDFNYILENLVIHAPIKEGDTDSEYIPIPPETFPTGTTDKTIIERVFAEFTEDKPGWFHIGGLLTAHTVALETPYKMQDPLTNFRVLLMEFVRLSDTIFWVDAYGGLWYTERVGSHSLHAPYALSRGGGAGVGTRSLSVMGDISNAVHKVIVWGDIAKPVKSGDPVDPGRIYARDVVGGIGTLAWQQYGEYDANTLHTERHVDDRAYNLLTRKGKVVWTAQARVTELGFAAGQTVSVAGAGDELVIKQMTVGFYAGGNGKAVVYWDLSCGVEPDDPWTYFDIIPFAT